MTREMSGRGHRAGLQKRRESLGWNINHRDRAVESLVLSANHKVFNSSPMMAAVERNLCRIRIFYVNITNQKSYADPGVKTRPELFWAFSED